MNDTQKYIAGLVVAAAYELLDVVFKAGLSLCIGLYQIACVFVYHQQVVVFVEYVFFAEHYLSFF